MDKISPINMSTSRAQTSPLHQICSRKPSSGCAINFLSSLKQDVSITIVDGVFTIHIHVLFSKQIILPLDIKKGHNSVTSYKVFFPQARLVQTTVEETNLCTPTQRKQSNNYNLFCRHIARYPHPQATTKVALFGDKPSQVIVMSHSQFSTC